MQDTQKQDARQPHSWCTCI